MERELRTSNVEDRFRGAKEIELLFLRGRINERRYAELTETTKYSEG